MEDVILDQEEIEEWIKKPWGQRRYIDDGDRKKILNTIKKFEDELKEVKNLEKFIQEGIMVTPQLILSAYPDQYNLNVTLRAFNEEQARFGAAGVFVSLRLNTEEIDRLLRLLPEALKAAKLHRDMNQLRKILEEKEKGRGW